MADEHEIYDYTVYFAPFTEEDKDGNLSFRVWVKAESCRAYPEPHATRSVNKLHSFCVHAAETIAALCRYESITKLAAKEAWDRFYKTLPIGNSGRGGPSLANVLFDGSDLQESQLERLQMAKFGGTPKEAVLKSGSYGPVWKSDQAGSDTQNEFRNRQSPAQSEESAHGGSWTFVVHSTDPTEFNASGEDPLAPQDLDCEDGSWNCDQTESIYVPDRGEEQRMALEHLQNTLGHQNTSGT